jgi:hypothetical protein
MLEHPFALSLQLLLLWGDGMEDLGQRAMTKLNYAIEVPFSLQVQQYVIKLACPFCCKIDQQKNRA